MNTEFPWNFPLMDFCSVSILFKLANTTSNAACVIMYLQVFIVFILLPFFAHKIRGLNKLVTGEPRTFKVWMM